MARKENNENLHAYLKLGAAIIIIIGIVVWLEKPWEIQSSGASSGAYNGNTNGYYSAEIGKPAPDFYLQSPDWTSVRLSELKGKPTIINFWASWCLACVEEMPLFEKAYEKDKGSLNIIGVNLMEDPAAISAFAANKSITYPLLVDLKGSVRDEYGYFGLPSTFFVDKNGILVDRVYGPLTESQLSEKISALLSQ